MITFWPLLTATPGSPFQTLTFPDLFPEKGNTLPFHTPFHVPFQWSEKTAPFQAPFQTTPFQFENLPYFQTPLHTPFLTSVKTQPFQWWYPDPFPDTEIQSVSRLLSRHLSTHLPRKNAVFGAPHAYACLSS